MGGESKMLHICAAWMHHIWSSEGPANLDPHPRVHWRGKAPGLCSYTLLAHPALGLLP